jgi:hypothetical protein
VNPDLLRTLRLAGAGLVVLVFLLALAGQAGALANYRWNVEPGYLWAAGAAALLRGPLIVYPWWRIVRSWGYPLGWWRAVRLYFHSGLARYAPGQWWFVPARAYLAEREGVPLSVTAASTAVETVVVTGAAAGVALVGLSTAPGLPDKARDALAILGILVPFVLVGLMMSDLSVRLWNRLAAVLKRGRIQPDILSGREARNSLFGAYGNWALYGMVAWCALAGVSGGSYAGQGLAVMGIFAASVLGGAVLLFVPQGIAVREGVLVYLLNALLAVPVPEAIVAAALTRLIAMAAEGVWAIAALGVRADGAAPEMIKRNEAKEGRWLRGYPKDAKEPKD